MAIRSSSAASVFTGEVSVDLEGHTTTVTLDCAPGIPFVGRTRSVAERLAQQWLVNEGPLKGQALRSVSVELRSAAPAVAVDLRGRN